VDIDDLQNPPTQAAPLILSYRSPPLSALAVTMMKQSQNLYAEAMMHAIGGPAEALSTLERWGISRDDILIADGSGLSRYNLVTAEVLVAILTHVGRDDRLRAPFAETLPVGGRDGTLAQRMKGSAAEGNVTAKTGSLSNARSLAGYLRTADGEPIVFAILANNFGVAPGIVEDAMDSMVTRLAEFRR
jgi:D-alanyl-D-alanine carboxypeptidase/D-alanyl-D-alanine-endopeptidase (penicillin-binding protein 4)